MSRFRWSDPNTPSVTHSIGVGIITDMTYTVPAEGDKRLVLKVKEFNPKTGELTILIPNKPDAGDGLRPRLIRDVQTCHVDARKPLYKVENGVTSISSK